jgi:hypothetical protein
MPATGKSEAPRRGGKVDRLIPAAGFEARHRPGWGNGPGHRASPGGGFAGRNGGPYDTPPSRSRHGWYAVAPVPAQSLFEPKTFHGRTRSHCRPDGLRVGGPSRWPRAAGVGRPIPSPAQGAPRPGDRGRLRLPAGDPPDRERNVSRSRSARRPTTVPANHRRALRAMAAGDFAGSSIRWTARPTTCTAFRPGACRSPWPATTNSWRPRSTTR